MSGLKGKRALINGSTTGIGLEPIGEIQRKGLARKNACLLPLRTRKQPVRSREEFRAPTGVRKSPKNEPAGHVRCAMGFLRSGWSSG